MADELAHRVEELAREVVAKIVLGGTLVPVRPFGPRLALSIGDGRRIVDDELRSAIDVARVRRARLLMPIDTLPDLDGHDWALAAALNDLIQVTNHELTSAVSRGRHMKLLRAVLNLVTRIPTPRDVGKLIARHATFARALEIVRTDRLVSWWTGKARFRGQPPSPRLLAWREVRRVQVDEQRVGLAAMCDGLTGITPEPFIDALRVWLGRSPLTDLATMTRTEPLFVWSGATLGLLAVPAARVLAHRVVVRLSPEVVGGVLDRATKELPEGSDVRAAAESFVADVAAAAKR